MPKYTFTKKNAAGEEFRAEGCDSFDEAIRKVEKGIADRDATLAEQAKKDAPAALTGTKGPAPAAPAAGRGPQDLAPAKPTMVEKYDAQGNVIP